MLQESPRLLAAKIALLLPHLTARSGRHIALHMRAPFVFTPLVLLFWRWQADRGAEPRDFIKMAIGHFLFAAAAFWLGCAEFVYGTGRAPLLWAVAFHIVSNIGWIYFQPTALALYSRLAPPRVNATMMGIYTLSVSRQRCQRTAWRTLRKTLGLPVLVAARRAVRLGGCDASRDRSRHFTGLPAGSRTGRRADVIRQACTSRRSDMQEGPASSFPISPTGNAATRKPSFTTRSSIRG
ncbi:MAG: hypothetical protein ACREHF_05180 [Rhizomicrobium sp.]